MLKLISVADEHRKDDKGQWCTYAYIKTDELAETTELAIAVTISGKAVTEPVWNFIKRERSEAEQAFINKNINRINKLLRR